MKVGFFDSGLGGLIILKAVAKELPDFDYIYYGDTLNLPYGDKTEEEVFTLTKVAIGELFERGCLLVVIACNTASAETLRKLQDTFLAEKYPDRKILGVIIPTVEALLDSGAKKALLLATKRTVESGKYIKELTKETNCSTVLEALATPELVPLIENGNILEALRVAQLLIDEFRMRVGEVDTVVLGCTHYAKLVDGLRVKYSPSIKFLSQDEIIPGKLHLYLERHPEIREKLSRGQTREIVLTEHREDYDSIASDLLGGAFLAS